MELSRFLFSIVVVVMVVNSQRHVINVRKAFKWNTLNVTLRALPKNKSKLIDTQDGWRGWYETYKYTKWANKKYKST